jgi:ribonuclease T2
MKKSALIVAAVVCLAAPVFSGVGQVFAASDCVLDRCVDQRPDAPASSDESRRGSSGFSSFWGGWGRNDRAQPRGASRPGDFDFYVLSLSWSPAFCQNGGASRSRRQCASGANPGFVVHGLWPQYNRGYPSDCRADGFVSGSALARTRGLYPDEGLARYEWRKHGTCSGKDPIGYFTDVRAAYDSVTIPPDFSAPRQDQDFSPLDIQRAFIAANPRLRPGMMAVACQRGMLQEVRICLSRDLRDFVACPEVARQACRSQSLNVPAGR